MKTSKGKPSAQSSQKSKNPVQVPPTESAKITKKEQTVALPNIPKDFLTFECGINKFQKALENFKVPSNSGYLVHMNSLINLIKSDSSIDADKQTNAYKMYLKIWNLISTEKDDINFPAYVLNDETKDPKRNPIVFLFDLYDKLHIKLSQLLTEPNSFQNATYCFILSCLICYIGNYYEKQEKDPKTKRKQRAFNTVDKLIGSLKHKQNDTNQKIQNLAQRMDDFTQRMDDFTQRIDDLTQNQMDTNKRIDDTNKQIGDLKQRMDDQNKKIDDTNKQIDDTNKQIGDLKQRMDDQNKKIDELSKQIGDLTKNLSLFLQQQNQAIQDTENKIKVIATAIQSGVQAINNPEFQSLTNPTQ